MTTEIAVRVLRNADFAELTDKQIRDAAPSVYAEEPRHDMSKQYQFVPTYELLNELRAQDFAPVEVQIHHRKNPAWRGYSAHLIRFSQRGTRGRMKEVGDVQPQIVLRNSHDGSSLMELYGGVMRMVCANGMIVAESGVVKPMRVRHATNPVLEALTLVDTVIGSHAASFEHINAMRKTKLSVAQQIGFARAALTVTPHKSVVAPEALLVPKRVEDNKNDVWHTLNRVQEYLIRGGMEGTTSAGRTVRMRGTESIQRQLEVNSALWALAMEAIGKADKDSRTTRRVANEVLDRARVAARDTR